MEYTNLKSPGSKMESNKFQKIHKKLKSILKIPTKLVMLYAALKLNFLDGLFITNIRARKLSDNLSPYILMGQVTLQLYFMSLDYTSYSWKRCLRLLSIYRLFAYL